MADLNWRGGDWKMDYAKRIANAEFDKLIAKLDDAKPLTRPEKHRLKKHGNINGANRTPTLNDFIHLYTLSFILSMHSCEVEKDKLIEVVEKLYETADCMVSGHINQLDVEKMCNDIYGIDFVANVKNKIFVDGTRFIKQ